MPVPLIVFFVCPTSFVTGKLEIVLVGQGGNGVTLVAVRAIAIGLFFCSRSSLCWFIFFDVKNPGIQLLGGYPGLGSTKLKFGVPIWASGFCWHQLRTVS